MNICTTCGKPGALEIKLGKDTILVSHVSCLVELDIAINQLTIAEMKKQLELKRIG